MSTLCTTAKRNLSKIVSCFARYGEVSECNEEVGEAVVSPQLTRLTCYSQEATETPRELKGLKNVELWDYQREGINWILTRYDRGISTILGESLVYSCLLIRRRRGLYHI